MISSLDSSSERFLADMARIDTQVSNAGRQLTSGKRIQVASDAPDQIEQLLQLRADLARNTQIQFNLGRAKTEVDAGEKALESATTLLDRALTLANQAATVTQTGENRTSIAGEVQGIHDQLVSISRTTVEGRYIFSGDRDQAPQYESDSSGAAGVSRLFASTATRQVEDPAGGAFRIAKTAQDILDSRNADDSLAADNVFAAVDGLRSALENNDPDAVSASMVSLRRASGRLNSALASYGAAQNRLQAGLDFASKVDVQLKTEISQKEDADVMAAIAALNQASLHQQAALSARAKMPHTTLFDFLA